MTKSQLDPQEQTSEQLEINFLAEIHIILWFCLFQMDLLGKLAIKSSKNGQTLAKTLFAIKYKIFIQSHVHGFEWKFYILFQTGCGHIVQASKCLTLNMQGQISQFNQVNFMVADALAPCQDFNYLGQINMEELWKL